ncbi:MAG: hypothetical protein WC644_05305 [Ignavibacteria bacterium]
MIKLSVISFLIFSVIVMGCGKEKEIKEQNEKVLQQEMEENDTTSLTPAESFGAVLAQSILNDESEVELESFLSESVYPKVSSASKVTIDKISSSLYLIKYYEGTAEKYLLIQKYYNPKEDSITFDITETGLTTSKQFLK